jgi:hypothetical protein
MRIKRKEKRTQRVLPSIVLKENNETTQKKKLKVSEGAWNIQGPRTHIFLYHMFTSTSF